MYNLLSELKNTLANDKRLIIDGNLSKNKIVELALGMDTGLLKLLLTNDSIKKHFFADVSGILVFDKLAFQNFVSNKSFLPDSYTAFKNKIGLTANREYLSESREVVLDWPYKDCVLEGGQTKEDQKRSEIFWNQTLAADEIDRLLEPKVLANFKKYTKNGEQAVNTVSIDDNLMIKGNNLLALHSLKQQYAGKVKLIYIDPPYNTGGGGDTFEYNNSFNHSTWLTFMKNRLDVARQLLHKNGAIIVAIDKNEQCHLGVLLHELFSNYDIHCITIIHNPGGNQGTNFSYTHEYAFFILPKNKKIIGLQDRSDNPDIRPLRDVSTGNHLRSDAKNCFYPIYVKDGVIIGFGEVSAKDFHPGSANVKNEDGVISIYPIDSKGNERKWVFARQTIESIKTELKVEYNKTRKIYDIKRYKTKFNYKTVWLDKRYDANQHGAKLLKKLLPQNNFTFPKSFYTVYDCLHAVVSNDKDAIILDYHAGSGTTAHAVLALNKEDGGNRKYILCEQMDYIQDVTVKRVQAVMKKENINSSLTYCELAEHNAKIITAIEKATTSEQLQKLWQKIQNSNFISYQVKPQSINANITEFSALNIDEQKQLLVALLDKNQLYVNYADIDDLDYQISREDKKLNHQFYGRPS